MAQNLSLNGGASTGPQCSWNIEGGGCSHARGASRVGLSRLGQSGLERWNMRTIKIFLINLEKVGCS